MKTPIFARRRGISYSLLSIDGRCRVDLVEAGSTVSATYADRVLFLIEKKQHVRICVVLLFV